MRHSIRRAARDDPTAPALPWYRPTVKRVARSPLNRPTLNKGAVAADFPGRDDARHAMLGPNIRRAAIDDLRRL